jgi:sulfur carrier protein ThiS
MSQTSTDAAPETPEAHHHLVEVSLETTNEDGDTQTTTLTIKSGPTKVTALKTELGIAEADPLWVIEKNGKRKPLGDHETHDVKEGDRYQALVKGGVS